jgi:predicted AAA+ superfamily ATPase
VFYCAKRASIGNGGNYEIDFIIQEGKDIIKIQVTQELNEENFDRELNSFSKVDKYLDQGENLLISLDTDTETINYKNTEIKRKNLIKWLLGIN